MEEFHPPKGSLAVNYVEFEAREVHRGFSAPVKYDQEQQLFILDSEDSSEHSDWMKADVEDLREAIREYQLAHPEDKGLSIDIEGCTWADVFQQMDTAKIENDARDNKGLGYCRVLWRKFGDKVKMEDINPWLDLIPNDYGVSVIRAAMVLILQAAQQDTDNRAKVRDFMIEVMQTVAVVCPKSKVYGRGISPLDTAIRRLYVAVLESSSKIVRYLRRKPKLARLGDKLRRRTPKEEDTDIVVVQKAVQSVKCKAEEFEREYNLFKDKLQREHYKLTYDSHHRLREMERGEAEIKTLVQEGNQLLREKLREQQEGQRQILEDLRFCQSICVQAMNGLVHLLRDPDTPENSRGRPGLLTPSRPALLRASTPDPRPPPYIINVDHLLQVLGIPIRLANEDLKTVVTRKSWFSGQDLGIAQSLLNYSVFRDWFAGAGSRVLLVDGRDHEHASEAICAMSILNADLMGSLHEAAAAGHGRQTTAMLHFFCGLHAEEGEGPTFMIKSLIVQLMSILLNHRCLDLSFIQGCEQVVELQNANSACLLHTMQQLCRQLPSYLTVYCFLDGIHFYESQWLRFHDDMVKFLRWLTWTILHSGSAGPEFGIMPSEYRSYTSVSNCYNLKVLLTSATGTIFDRHILNCIALSQMDVSFGLSTDATIGDMFGQLEYI